MQRKGADLFCLYSFKLRFRGQPSVFAGRKRTRGREEEQDKAATAAESVQCVTPAGG